MCNPSPPPSPDYAGAAAAQGAANLEAAIAQGHINNPNVVNPMGTQNVTWNGNQPTITQTLCNIRNPETRLIIAIDSDDAATIEAAANIEDERVIQMMEALYSAR